MPDRKELLEAALAIYLARDEHVVDRVRMGESIFKACVLVAKSLLSAVDAECPKFTVYARKSHGFMGGVDTPITGYFSVFVREGETLPSVLTREVPEVRALVEAAERVLNDMPELVTLRRVLAPFRRERSA